MISILFSYLAIFTPVLALGLFLGWLIPWWCRQWAAARAVIADAQHAASDLPVPYWPADTAIDALAQAVTCHWCAARPTGRCICGVWCGHQQCPRLTRAELDYLDRGTEMPR